MPVPESHPTATNTTAGLFQDDDSPHAEWPPDPVPTAPTPSLQPPPPPTEAVELLTQTEITAFRIDRTLAILLAVCLTTVVITLIVGLIILGLD